MLTWRVKLKKIIYLKDTHARLLTNNIKKQTTKLKLVKLPFGGYTNIVASSMMSISNEKFCFC